MSSTEFNVDSLLDDINDVDISTPWGGSSMKDVSLLPGSEKLLVNVRFQSVAEIINSPLFKSLTGKLCYPHKQSFFH